MSGSFRSWFVALVAVMVVSACGDGGDSAATTTAATPASTEPATSTTTPPSTATTTSTNPPVTTATTAASFSGPASNYAEFRALPAACGATAPADRTEMSFEAPADQGLTGPVTVTIVTSCGDVVLELDPALAPETVNSFVFLARQGYFDGTASHRIVPGFVIQAGDPTATGRGGPGYVIADEYPTDDGFTYQRGMIAMANAGPGTTGSQFFIVLENWPPRAPTFNYFGRVVAGLDVLDRIATDIPLTAQTPGGEVSTPLESLYIERIEIDG